MSKLPDEPTVCQVKEFLAAVEPKADADKPAKLNKQLTRHQAWEIFVNGVKAHQEKKGLQDRDPFFPADWETYARENRGRLVPPLAKIMIRNINREFGTGKVMA